ncbi:hydroxyisourate hydrolase [Salinarimonas sp. NSM]|uniref:hydroxyisourate hydrolase n=1 Tax=Salinarimonas sp. NSM TaxID=3458003 RepID=UPI004036B7DB
MSKSPITTHILDLGRGLPAAGVDVILERVTTNGTETLASGSTDADGRIMQWFDAPLSPGHYRLRFATGAWYQARGLETFYPEVSLDFQVSDTDAHYHVPLLLNQWGYSTYRGS